MDDLTAALGREEFDLVAVGRALLADPLWFKKTSDGEHNTIIPFAKEMTGFSS